MGKLFIRKLSALFLALLLAGMVGVLTGCSGDDGAPGPPGDTTAADAAAAAAQASADAAAADAAAAALAAEAAQDEAADLRATLDEEGLPKHYYENDTLGKMTVTVNEISTADGVMAVDFSLTDEEGDGVTGVGLDSNRFYVSDIVPAGTDTDWGTYTTDYLELWAYERDSSSYPTGTWAEVGNGDYTYTFATPIFDPAFNCGLGDNPVTCGTRAPDYSDMHAQRLVMRVDGRPYGYIRAVGIQDFSTDGTFVDPQRVLAPTDGCKSCHSPYMEEAAHAGGYLDTRACAQCHSPIGGAYGDTMQESGAWLTNLIHKIHAAIPMEAFENRIGGKGYGAVTYPRQVKECAFCHTGSDFMTDAFLSNPSIVACTTCHDVTFGDNPTHSGGIQAEGSCAVCHPKNGPGLGQSVTDAHELTTMKKDTAHAGGPPPPYTPNYTSDITLSPDADADGVYEVGEAIQVTVTTSNYVTGDYTIPYTEDVDENQLSGTRTANLYVYGPRAETVPVLTPGSITDLSVWEEDDVNCDVPDDINGDGICDQAEYDILCCTLPLDFTGDQGRTMKIDSNIVNDPVDGDANILTDADGFKYQLQAIPADLPPGTYMAMAYVTTHIDDCSGIYRGSVCIDGWTLTTFQVGTATVEPKVAGDGCESCHDQNDWTAYYHRSYFGTDGCIACHDKSGNHANFLSNRVHAVHSANTAGDLLAGIEDQLEVIGEIDPDLDVWGEVTYPTALVRCVTCHRESDSYQSNMSLAPCIGCHGDEDLQIFHHMETNENSCFVCHGPGKDQAIF